MEIKITIDEESLRSIIREELGSMIPKPQVEKNILNGSEVCDMLGIHLSTLNQWKKQGRIPFKRMGKRCFFNRDEVLKTLEDQRRRL